MPQLTCNNLTLGYDGKVVVSDLSFSINAGDYLCVVGDNGSGKSTLLKTLLNLKTPMSGQIVSEVKPDEIGYLPQQTAVQKDFPASVREIVRSGCLNSCGLRPFYDKTEKNLAEHTMTALGISHLAKRCYRELSGGQQQRVLLARALCAAENMLLLDEPVAGLDPAAADLMYKLIKKVNSGGITVIMISHDITSSVKYASHVLHLGAQSSFGTTEEFLRRGGKRA